MLQKIKNSYITNMEMTAETTWSKKAEQQAASQDKSYPVSSNLSCIINIQLIKYTSFFIVLWYFNNMCRENIMKGKTSKKKLFF